MSVISKALGGEQEELLAVLKGQKAVGAVTTMRTADIHVIPGFNLRPAFDVKAREADKSLWLNMLANGYNDEWPMLVRWNPDTKKIEVLEGHRRLDAAKLAGIETVAVRLTTQPFDMVKHTLALIQSNSGEQLTPAAMGAAILRLEREVDAKGEKLTREELAKKLGKSVKTLHNYVAALARDAYFGALVAQGQIRNTTVTILAGYHGEDVAKQIVAYAVEHKLAKQEPGKGQGEYTLKSMAPAELAITGGTPKCDPKADRARIAELEAARVAAGPGGAVPPNGGATPPAPNGGTDTAQGRGPARDTAPATPPAPAATVSNGGTNGKTVLSGMFKVVGDAEIHDTTGRIGYGDSPAKARAIVDALNEWHRAPAPVVMEAPATPPATPPVAPVAPVESNVVPMVAPVVATPPKAPAKPARKPARAAAATTRKAPAKSSRRK